MNNLNNRGFTIVEIIISFSFVMVIALGLFLITTNYKNKQQLESSKRDLLTYKTTLVSDIQNDITIKGINTITACPNISNCYDLTFNDSTKKRIQKKVETNNSYISYDNTNYYPKEKNLTTIGDFVFNQKNTEVGTVYKLLIPIEHRELIDTNYNIKIVTTSFKNS